MVVGIRGRGPTHHPSAAGIRAQTWWPAEQSSRLRAVRQLYRTPDGLELNGAIERGKATYSRHVWIDDTDPATARHDKTRLVGQFYVTPGGRTRLFTGNEDLPFGSIEVQAQRGSSVIQIDQGGQDLSLSPDGRHILWAGYEQLMTRPVDGSEAVRIADAYRTASVGPHGIIAHPARSQRFADLWDWDDGTRFDPPLLPDRLCFTLAPWASIETPIPAMPPGETVAIEEPVRPLPGVVRSLSALLPTKVDGHDVSWSGAVLLESPRDSSSFEFPRMVWPQALPFAARELGVDPFDLFIGAGTVWSDDPDDLEDDDDAPEVTVWADPDGDGSRWVEPLVRALETYGRRTRIASVDAITLAGREVMRVEAKDPGVEFGHQTDYVLASGPYVFLINTNIRSMAKEVVAALP